MRKSILTAIPFLLLTLFSYRIQAQCSFELIASVEQHSNCIANGKVKVNLSGDAVDLAKVNIALSGPVTLSSTTNDQVFTDLPSGNYEVTTITFCKGTTSIVSQTAKVTINIKERSEKHLKKPRNHEKQFK